MGLYRGLMFGVPISLAIWCGLIVAPWIAYAVWWA
jgi:hypothetical protein